MSSFWQQYEHLFREGKTNAEIMALTGKGESAVRHKRQRMIQAGENVKPEAKPKLVMIPKGDGWQAGVEWDGKQGTLTTGPIEAPPSDWTELLKVWDLDPEVYEVVEPVQFRAWDSNVGGGEVKRMFYYRASVVRSRPDLDDSAIEDVDLLIERVRKSIAPLPTPPESAATNSSFAVLVADTQIGKDEGGGTEATIARIQRGFEQVGMEVEQRWTSGRPGPAELIFLGDLFEGCAGFYAQQTFRVDRNRRQQAAILRRLILEGIEQIAPFVTELRVSGVGGNHGENRQDGASFTDFSDNDDVAVLEQVQLVIEGNRDRYPNVEFVIPQDSLELVLDVSGVKVALAHGHQFGKSGTPLEKARKWWAGQSHGLRPAGEATILLTGHNHHLIVDQQGAKTIIQAPALDGGSQWFTNVTGNVSPPGMLTLDIGTAFVGGWSNLMDVLR